MDAVTYNIIAAILAVGILWGLHLMSNVQKAVLGNAICAASMAIGIIITMLRDNSFTMYPLWIAIGLGMIFGLFLANKVKMIQMPQLVAFLHGFGGGAAALVGLIMLIDVGPETLFHRIDACLALCSGMTTITGSFIAAGKLHRVLPQKPVILPAHSAWVNCTLGLMLLALIVYLFTWQSNPALGNVLIAIMFLTGAAFGIIFTLRVGGADMPITISLLNSMGGISCAIAGFAVADPLLIAVGGIIGSAGYMLTRVMCKAMNRRLMPILLGQSSVAGIKAKAASAAKPAVAKQTAGSAAPEMTRDQKLSELLHKAKKVIIVPGYGMALAQAQHQVKKLADALEANGASVDYAIHPVAGRMPGHMNVLLAEANVEYEHLLEMETVNPMFADADLVLVVGANDVVNPAANTAEGTPIYGMPVLDVDKAKNVIICNYDDKPGYAGVENPLYNKQGVILMLGDASKTVADLANLATKAPEAGGADKAQSQDQKLCELLHKAKKVIIVPGYGMALAQAQHQVKKLADALEANGASVDYAIHPVAGRMPGHMNVLLAEANVDYEHLLEMETVNPMFADADLVLVVGANDVVNPAANTAEGTPIYGMPVLDVDKAKNIIICNYDDKPGYAGVENPLYSKQGVILMLGDASKTVADLANLATKAPEAGGADKAQSQEQKLSELLHKAKKVIIVPGYGMALAQAQHQVKKLADALEANGASVDYAIHPVAGRMPGHMNVLLAEANVEYEHLLEMETVNPMFADADLVLVVGANDVVNPAANTAEGTPIYGMPVLDVDKAKNVIICNYDDKPGYAGVENPLYNKQGVILMLGDASKTVADLANLATKAPETGGADKAQSQDQKLCELLHKAKKVIIVPGYGMALAQAQHQVKKLADALEANGASVDYAIHPVAGRMPGHMNVLLAEANVEYEHLLEMETVNPMFADADLVLVVGANDVVNPAANTAEGTPIYGMPVLDVDSAKNVIICNYDDKPGYAGVDNPLYGKEGVILMLGDASDTVAHLANLAESAPKSDAAGATPELSQDEKLSDLLHKAKKVIIVPGYGMALAQAQHQVKKLADALEANGASVDYAIHPVAGRMPGHMNVLLAEASVDYEHLLEMETVNPMFADADLVLVVGANDVVNPAANTAEGTPIYGMPVLDVDSAKNVIICNYDDKPGYAGVDNPLYGKEGVILMLGDAGSTVGHLAELAGSKA